MSVNLTVRLQSVREIALRIRKAVVPECFWRAVGEGINFTEIGGMKVEKAGRDTDERRNGAIAEPGVA